MGQYEPHDSRALTQNRSKTPVEPARTGPREKETRTANANEEHASERSARKGPQSKQERGDADRWKVDENGTRES